MGDPVEADTGQSWEDQRSTYDAMRSRCPVAHDDGAWVALRHAEVVAAASDAETFSSRVTTRRAIPNSLDGAEHAAYRAVVDRFLTEDRVAAESRGVEHRRWGSSTLARLAPRDGGRAGRVDAGQPRGDPVGGPRPDHGGWPSGSTR